jgi:uncharacterized membrane protein YfcA
MRKPRVSEGLPILLGLAVGVAVVVWLPWQFAAIAVCIFIVFALANYFASRAKKLPSKLPAERGTKVEEKNGGGAN